MVIYVPFSQFQNLQLVAFNEPMACFFIECINLTQVSAEMKKKAAEAKARGDEAFKKQDFMLAVDAYTQVCFTAFNIFLILAFCVITYFQV